LVPEGLAALAPWYRNVFENVTTVQFDHRVTAYIVAVLAVAHLVALIRSHAEERVIGSAGVLAGAVLVQMLIGIWTLVSGAPLALGLAHQAGAALVIAAATLHLHAITRADVS
jgi:cytochrome c oxidase assembly protein subunit 15